MKKILSLVLVLATLLSCVSLAAADETVKITYFPGNSMAGSGELTGGNGAHFAKHGLVVEIIPYSAEKLQGMLASGDLADVMWLPEQELKIAMEADMLLNLEEYLPAMTALQENAEWFTPSLNFAREYNSNGTGNVYYLAPVGGPTIAVAADTDRNAIKMNWALYKNSGYPAFSSLEDSIEVFKKMQQDNPTNEAGLPTYAIHMFSDFDTEYFYNMYSIYSILGKDYTYLPYGIEYDASTHSGTSIFAEGSVYYRGLKYFYEMNKAGLVDPDSMSQTRSTAKAKIESGAALAGWAANPGWESNGYYPVLFDDFVPAYKAATSYGVSGYCISADCKNPEAAIKFLDLLANEDFVMDLRNGPRGYNWDIDENGTPYLTDRYYETVSSNEPLVDAEGNVWEYWNNGYLLSNGFITKYGTTVCCANWPAMYEYTYSSADAQDWKALYGYSYLRELLNDKNWKQAAETEGYSSFLTADDDDMKMTKAALKDIIVPASWQMVFASSEEEFEKIWNDMKSKCESLGIDYVIETKLADIANAREIYHSLAE